MAKLTKPRADSHVEVECDAPPANLLPFLGHKNGWVRHHARECLVRIGESSVPDLMEALGSKNEDVRWEAAKALGQIGDSKAAPALVKALRDENFGVRWLAAEGLIIMGHDAIAPLLQELIEYPDAIWLRQSAHHVLRDLSKKSDYQLVTPLLAAMEGLEPALEVPRVAKNLLEKIVQKKLRGKRQMLSRSS